MTNTVSDGQRTLIPLGVRDMPIRHGNLQPRLGHLITVPYLIRTDLTRAKFGYSIYVGQCSAYKHTLLSVYIISSRRIR